MKTKLISYNSKEALVIYADKQERYAPEVEEYITNSKRQYTEVVIFVSGDTNLENILRSLIYDM